MLDWREQQQSAHLSGINAACRVAFQELRCDSPNEKWGVSEKTQLPLSQSEQFCELVHRGQGRTDRNCFSWEMWLHVFPLLPYRQADFCQVFAFPDENYVQSFPNLPKAFCLFHFHSIVRKDKRTDGRDRWDDNNRFEACNIVHWAEDPNPTLSFHAFLFNIMLHGPSHTKGNV